MCFEQDVVAESAGVGDVEAVQASVVCPVLEKVICDADMLVVPRVAVAAGDEVLDVFRSDGIVGVTGFDPVEEWVD